MGASFCCGNSMIPWTLLALAWLAGLPIAGWSATSLPAGPVRAVALKMDADNPTLNRRTLLSSKLAAVTSGVGGANVDLVVVPEYTFFVGYENDPVRIRPDGTGYYQTVSIGTAKSDEIVAAVNETKAWAQANNCNLILGTVSELLTTADDPTLLANVVFNSQLIIDRQGRIIGYKRKVTEFVRASNPISAIKQKALQTVRTFTLSTKSGMSFVVFPIICAERYDFEMLTKAANFNADLIVKSEREGDCSYEELTQSIQAGTWDPTAWGGWIMMIRDILIKNYVVDRNVVKPGGWLVVAESSYSMGGIIELHVPPGPLASLSITADYVYGVIQFTNRSESANQAPAITPAPSANPNPVALPAQATVSVTASDPDSGPLPLYYMWSKVSGPGSVNFSPNGTASAGSSTATFGAAGPYILRVEVSDGMVETAADLAVLVTGAGPIINKAPAVSAGPDQSATFPASVSLTGKVLDDGLPSPPGAVTVTWSQANGPPGGATFGNIHAVSTTVTFSVPGTYYLRLTANDGALSSFDEVGVTVNPVPPAFRGDFNADRRADLLFRHPSSGAVWLWLMP